MSNNNQSSASSSATPNSSLPPYPRMTAAHHAEIMAAAANGATNITVSGHSGSVEITATSEPDVSRPRRDLGEGPVPSAEPEHVRRPFIGPALPPNFVVSNTNNNSAPHPGMAPSLPEGHEHARPHPQNPPNGMRERVWQNVPNRRRNLLATEGSGWGKKTSEEVEKDARKERDERRARGEEVAPGWEHEEDNEGKEEEYYGQYAKPPAAPVSHTPSAPISYIRDPADEGAPVPDEVAAEGRAEEWRAAEKQRDRDAEAGKVFDCCMLGQRGWWCSCWM
ncbi:uncharacterized protein AB675_7572 [Cyphellophora attinorum]|uniref:Uncharacterized protein n=1 Tax=Cyphellophora attinorum TaxID=1664694 RepID=A0A0N0NMH6_9EURO|nr:uncharacterized protein AB675_7572 [Phialophora attinorum]KPI40471.1 hypothetical protein AB675_7572 [Phialophora attinorum]